MRGARIDRIAERAGMNKRLIYYYFGNKDDLFLAVLERVYADIRRAEQALHPGRDRAGRGTAAPGVFTWNYYLEHPRVHHPAQRWLHQASHLQKSTQDPRDEFPLVQLLGNVLARGPRKLFRAGIDPVQLYISIASLCYFYLSNNPTLSTVFGRDLRTPKAMAERLSHMTDLVLGYALV